MASHSPPLPASLLADGGIVRRGDVLAGKYRLVRELGSGAQGRVWEAVHIQMGTPLALKVLDPTLAHKPDYFTRFKQEANAAAQLRSSHVVQIFDFGITNNIPYIAMELLEGEDLGTRLDRQRTLSPAETSALITQVARALARAHKRQIIHRDLKPDNIFLCTAEEGETELVKVLDFGLAKGLMGQNLSRTSTGIVVGTPYYMSPEQAQGDRKIDHHTDLWSLGVIAYECLVGLRPFEATNLGDLLIRICAHPTPVPSSVRPDLPEGFDAWFQRACARDPDSRFNSANELANTLALVCGKGANATTDSSYASANVATLPPDKTTTDEHEARIISAGEPTGRTIGHSDAPNMGPTPADTQRTLPSIASHEDDATQVMSELPTELNESSNAEIDIPIDIKKTDIIPAQQKPAVVEDRFERKLTPLPSSLHAVRRPKPTPAHGGEPLNKLFTLNDSDDDARQLFGATDIAVNIAREVQLHKQREARRRKLESLMQQKWPLVAGAVALLVLAAAILRYGLN